MLKSIAILLSLIVLVGCQKPAENVPVPQTGTTPPPVKQTSGTPDKFSGVYTMVLSNEQMKANQKLLQNGLPQMVGSLKIGNDGEFEMSTSGGNAVISVTGHSEKDGDSIKLVPEKVNGQKVTSGADTNPTTFVLDKDGTTLISPEAKLTFRKAKA